MGSGGARAGRGESGEGGGSGGEEVSSGEGADDPDGEEVAVLVSSRDLSPFKDLLAKDQLGLAGRRGFKALLASDRQEEGEGGVSGGRGEPGRSSAEGEGDQDGERKEVALPLRISRFCSRFFTLLAANGESDGRGVSRGGVLRRGRGAPVSLGGSLSVEAGMWGAGGGPCPCFGSPRAQKRCCRRGFFGCPCEAQERVFGGLFSSRLAGIYGAWWLQPHLSGAAAGCPHSSRRWRLAGAKGGSCGRCEQRKSTGRYPQSLKSVCSIIFFWKEISQVDWQRGLVRLDPWGFVSGRVSWQSSCVPLRARLKRCHQTTVEGRVGPLMRLCRHAWQDLPRQNNDGFRAEGRHSNERKFFQASGLDVDLLSGAGVGGVSGEGKASPSFRRHRFASPVEEYTGNLWGPRGGLRRGSWVLGGLFKCEMPTARLNPTFSFAFSEVWWARPTRDVLSSSGFDRLQVDQTKGMFEVLSLEPKVAFGKAILIAYWVFYTEFCFLSEPDPG